MSAGEYQILQIVLFVLVIALFSMYLFSKEFNWFQRAFVYVTVFMAMLWQLHVQPSTSQYLDMVSREHMEIYYNFYHCKAKLNHVTVADSLHLILTEKCNLTDIKNNFKL